MAKEKYKKTDIIVMDDKSEILAKRISIRETIINEETGKITLTIDYYSDANQKNETLHRIYSYIYDGDIEKFKMSDRWDYLLTLPQHSGATII